MVQVGEQKRASIVYINDEDVELCCCTVDDSSEAVRVLGYPRVHRHRLACLRQELVDAFVE